MIKGIGMTALSLVVLLLGASMVIAAGDVDKGKRLFNDPGLGGGTAGRSCNTCHPGGKGLEGASLKKEWKTPGGMHKTIEEAVNTCIVMALKGEQLDVRSEQMQALVISQVLEAGRQSKEENDRRLLISQSSVTQ